MLLGQQVRLRLLRVDTLGGAFVDLLLHQRGQHPARADGVAGDIASRCFQPHHLGQADHAVLGRHIGGFADGADQPVHRGDIDDSPPVTLTHARQRQARAMEYGRQVQGDDLVPAFWRELLNRCHMLDTGVVDQDVDAAELALGQGEQRFDLGHVRQVGRVMDCLHPVPGDLGQRRGWVAEAVEHDVGACAGQHLGNAQADAAGGTGDECGLAFEGHAKLLRRCRWRRTWR
ncbi:hypothetical protein D3C75_804120 [compost metagenome]